MPTAVSAGLPIDPAAIPQAEEVETAQKRDFDVQRDPATFRTAIRLSAPLEPGVASLNVNPGPLVAADGAVIEPEQVFAEAVVDQRGRRDWIDLRVCVDPVVAVGDSVLRTAAGSYTGTVLIDDPRIVGGAATYSVNLKYSDRAFVILTVGLAAALGGAAGFAFASSLSLRTLSQNKARAVSALVAWSGAAYTVYTAQYENDPAWEGTFPLFASLFATALGAAYAATNFTGSVSRA